MRVVLQRVRRASVEWEEADGVLRRQIGRGVVLLVGIGPGDDEKVVAKMAGKLAGLRIFEDEGGRTNLSLAEIGGEALIVSQFTLYADLSRGRRPGFTGAGDPARASALYQLFCTEFAATGVPVSTGEFGAAMVVSLDNDGPFTIVAADSEWPAAL